MLTIFSIPKPFEGHVGTIQRNAIESWLRLRPRPEILLMGDDAGVGKVAADLGLRHVPVVERNALGTPLVSSVFRTAGDAATHSRLCYVNADIILLSDFGVMAQRPVGRSSLIVGCRTDFDQRGPVDFTTSTWESDLRREVVHTGRLHSHRGIDYFLYPRGFWSDIPPFAVGRLLWDNWLIYDARRRGQRVVDATRVATVVHQNHEYTTTLRAAHGGWNWQHPETQRNLELAGGHDCAFTIRDATHVMLSLGTWPAVGADYLRRRLEQPRPETDPGAEPSRLGRVILRNALRVHGLARRARTPFLRRAETRKPA